jgi:crotonobetaine/carnitine-CoA ligase
MSTIVKRERNEAILADLIAIRAEQKPDLDVLTFERWSLGSPALPDEVRTYAQLHTNANRFALMMRNHPEFVETLIAASITGCVAVPIDPRTRGERLAYTLRDAGCRGIVTADYCLSALAAVRTGVPDLAWMLALESGEASDAPPIATRDGIGSLRAVLVAPAPTVAVRLASPEDPLQIIYTSGTTGDPKGVVFPNARFGAFAFLGALLGYRPDDRPYTGLSLTHGNAQAVTLGPALYLGLRAVFSRRFTKSKLWDVCRRYGCTTFSMLGGMATAPTIRSAW